MANGLVIRMLVQVCFEEGSRKIICASKELVDTPNRVIQPLAGSLGEERSRTSTGADL